MEVGRVLERKGRVGGGETENKKGREYIMYMYEINKE